MDRWVVLGVLAIWSMLIAGAAHTQEAPPSSSAGLDPRHPPKIGADFYPKESLRNHEEGTTLIRLYSESDGSVPATQILVSSGFQRLDLASLVAWVDAATRPATSHGATIATWVNFRTRWRIEATGRVENTPLDPSVTPQMRDDYRPEFGPGFYPRAALEMRLEGNCLVHFKVSERGIPSEISISKSTGYASLDQACVTAIQDAQFVAAKRDGKDVEAWTDLFINWKLPPS